MSDDALAVQVGPTVPCPVCGAAYDQQRPLFSKHGVAFCQCRDCGLGFVNPRPTEAWLASHYDTLGREYFLDPSKIRSDFNAQRYDVELTLLRGLGGRLLDIGCATGSFVKLALDIGLEATGIDIDRPAVEFGQQLGLPLEHGDFTDGHLGESTYDVVTLWATLEHLAFPAAFLDEARRLLRPGGNLLVSVPNGHSLTTRILGRKDRYVCVEHLNYFKPNTLSELLRRHGFAVDHVATRKINPKTVVQDLLADRSRRTPSEMISDQRRTDFVKYAPVMGPIRWAHAGLERGLGLIGMGDLLLVRAAKA